MNSGNWSIPLGLFCAVLVLASPVRADSDLARKYCAKSGNTSEESPIPQALAPDVAKAFGIDLAMARASSFYRCVEGRLLVCTVGANLPCGKANSSRQIAEASEFCRKNPDSIGIPMAITGHNTIYSWRCIGSAAKAEGPAATLDEQGYFVGTWKKL